MKNRLACLFHALVMTLSCFVFAACSSKTEEEALEGSEQDSTKLTTATLTLWIPTDKSTTEEAILAVQEAINKITKAKF
jgi:thiamine biosynthesis lipoprotein ApbE